MYEYLFWLLIFVILPLIILYLLNFNYLKKYNFVFLLAITCSLIFAFPWDLIAIYENIWYFTEPQILGTWFLGLPIEEYLFIIFLHFDCLYICSIMGNVALF